MVLAAFLHKLQLLRARQIAERELERCVESGVDRLVRNQKTVV